MSYGRPREFDIDRALEAATEQFWSVGYEATSLQDLLKSMRLSKSSLYQTFGNKHALFVRCIEHYQQTMVGELQQRLANSSSARRFVTAFLDDVISEAVANRGKNTPRRKGCFLVNTVNELCQRDDGIAKAVNDGTNNLANVFAQTIEMGKQKKEIRADVSTGHLVNYFMTALSGLRTMVKTGVDKRELMPVVKLITETIFIKSEFN
jgi:TetR/AcrR family transcriptional repressor of nem operon